MTTGDTPVKNLMTEELVTVSAKTTVEAAAARLVGGDVQSVIVVDETETPVGLFTTTDLANLVAARRGFTDALVADHMTTDLFTVGPDETVQAAAAKMIQQGIHHLPVIDEDDGVVGILSTLDLTGYLSATKVADAE